MEISDLIKENNNLAFELKTNACQVRTIVNALENMLDQTKKKIEAIVFCKIKVIQLPELYSKKKYLLFY